MHGVTCERRGVWHRLCECVVLRSEESARCASLAPAGLFRSRLFAKRSRVVVIGAVLDRNQPTDAGLILHANVPRTCPYVGALAAAAA